MISPLKGGRINKKIDNGMADIVPLHKDDDATNKTNYRPISMLPIVTKVFEKLIQNQIGGFINTKLFPFMCGYRKGYSTQYALIAWMVGVILVLYSWIYRRLLTL